MNVKLFASVAVIALTMCALGGIVLASDDSDAAPVGDMAGVLLFIIPPRPTRIMLIRVL